MLHVFVFTDVDSHFYTANFHGNNVLFILHSGKQQLCHRGSILSSQRLEKSLRIVEIPSEQQ